jgi:oxalate decarboxylase/phosphoglucose isomerase-like protein (cupin superfamily)
MKVNNSELSGKVIRNNETYIVEDNTFLNNLVLSKTTLHPGKETTGHSHEGLEEVYFFIKGEGKMLLKTETTETNLSVGEGDIVLIPDGAFHKVFNHEGKEDLEFVCVFQKYER